MEGIYGLRMFAVAALFLGSIWVLLPTALRGSAEDRLSAAAQGVEAPAQGGAQLDYELPVTEGEASAIVPVLTKRFEQAGVKVDKVEAGQGTVQVKRGAGAGLGEVAALARAKGQPTLHPVELLVELPPKGEAPSAPPQPGPWDSALTAAAGADAAYWAAVVPKLVGVTVAPETVALPLTVAKAEPTPAGATLSFQEGQTWPEPSAAQAPFAALAIDGQAHGIVFSDGAFYALGDPAVPRALLVSGPLPGQLGEPVSNAAPTEAPQAEAEQQPSRVPAWLTAILPDTAIVLGLDLQGGIDLTLQVDLEEAVLGQVARDAASLKDAAGREGLAITSLRRAHTTPVLEIVTDAPLADLQTFLRKYAREYEYVDSQGNEHRFELSEAQQEAVGDSAVDQVLDTLRKRVNATGVEGGSITRKSGGRINVQLPGMSDMQSAIDAIGTTAVLEFRMVDDEFDDAYLEQILVSAKAALPPDQFEDDKLVNIWLWEQKKLDEDRLILWEYEPIPAEEGGAPGQERRYRAYPLKNEIVLTGNDINDAGVGWDQNQQAYVTLDFKPRGGQIFCDVTGQNVGKQFAVILDNKVQSAPSIRERICGGSARIDMGGSEDPTRDAQTLALVLRTGALDAPVVIASSRYVGPSLGQDSIREGTIAALIGSVLVYLFMVLWYRLAGVIADVALTINILMLLAVLALMGAELTLTGIAGLALTVGMAVDSNIIIYERIREELKLGVHPRKAVDIGFEKALVAVVDANITTAIAGIVLYSYGDVTVKGFAVTLLIGIVTTLVTAVFVTRTIMDALTRSSATRLQI